MKRRTLMILTPALWAAVHLAAACDTRAPATADPSVDVVFDAGANDEALAALLDAEEVDDDAQSAFITAPATSTLDPDVPPRFDWQVGSPDAAIFPSEPAAPRAPSSRRFGALLDLVTPVQIAHAHGAPVNGRAYLLELENQSGTVIYQLFTTNLHHLLTPSKWRELVDASGGSIHASVINAVFINDVIAEGGGPWRGPSTSFQLNASAAASSSP